MPSRIMQNMSGVKHVNMPAKLLSPHSQVMGMDGDNTVQHQAQHGR